MWRTNYWCVVFELRSVHSGGQTVMKEQERQRKRQRERGRKRQREQSAAFFESENNFKIIGL